MKTIAIIDDDIDIGDVLEELLKKEGYQVLRAYSGTEALLLLSLKTPDLVLLDLMLPGLSGEDVLPKLQGIPVMILSARVDVDSKVSMLLNGAMDYITKPFEPRELLARIAVQLRKAAVPDKSEALIFDDCVLDVSARSVTAAGKKVRLTKTEYAILKHLMQNPSQVITKSRILELISEDTPDCVEASLKVHISNLRRKLKEAGGKDYIESVWGIGFKMREE